MQAGEPGGGFRSCVAAAVFVEDLQARAVGRGFDEDDQFGKLLGFGGFFAEQAADEAGFFRADRGAFVLCGLHEEGVFFGVLADNGQADAVEGEGGAAPVALIVARQKEAAVFEFGKTGRAAAVGGLLELVLDLLLVGAEVLHEAGEEGSFEVGVVGAGLPHGGFFFAVGIGFAHAFVGKEDVGGAVAAFFDADDEFVAFAGGVDAAEADFFEDAAQAAAGEFGAVFRPVGFHLADGGFFGGDGKAAFLPKGFEQRPEFGGLFAGDGEPALAAVAFHFDAFDAAEDGLSGGGLFGGVVAVEVAGAYCADSGGQLVEVALVGVVQVGRDFEADDFAVFRLVVEFGLFFFAARAG